MSEVIEWPYWEKEPEEWVKAPLYFKDGQLGLAVDKDTIQETVEGISADDRVQASAVASDNLATSTFALSQNDVRYDENGCLWAPKYPCHYGKIRKCGRVFGTDSPDGTNNVASSTSDTPFEPEGWEVVTGNTSRRVTASFQSPCNQDDCYGSNSVMMYQGYVAVDMRVRQKTPNEVEVENADGTTETITPDPTPPDSMYMAYYISVPGGGTVYSGQEAVWLKAGSDITKRCISRHVPIVGCIEGCIDPLNVSITYRLGTWLPGDNVVEVMGTYCAELSFTAFYS